MNLPQEKLKEKGQVAIIVVQQHLLRTNLYADAID